MLLKLILILTLVPLGELVLLLQIHHALSALWGPAVGMLITVGTIIVTGVAGASLARQQGLGVIRELRSRLGRGELPTQSLLDGLLILVGAAMLLTPGFITDLVGFSFLLPVTRPWYRRLIQQRFRVSVQSAGPAATQPHPNRPDVFVVEPVGRREETTGSHDASR